MSFERPAPDLTKLLAAWEEFERGLKENLLHLGGQKFTRDELYDRN